MSKAPEVIWANPNGDVISIRNGYPDLNTLIATGRLTKYVRADRIAKLEAENHLLKTSGIAEVAVRNPNVMEYMRHWEGRAERAEAKLAKAVEAFMVLSDYENLDRSGGYYDGGCCILSYQARKRYGDFDEIARTTIAELTSSESANGEAKGGNDE